MTFFEIIPDLEARALAMPKMHEMLTRLNECHAALHKEATGDGLWRRVGETEDQCGKERHIAAAREAGFINVRSTTGISAQHISITAKGRAVIGADKPFWEKETDQ